MRASALYLQTIMLVAFMALSLGNLTVAMSSISKGLIYRLEDKTARPLNDANYGNTVVYKGKDLLMSLVVIDEFNPYPRKFRIDGGAIIRLDNAWMANKATNVTAIYNSSIKGKEEYIVRSRYVYDEAEYYIHYTTSIN